jgi:hypothetical protein
MHIKNFLHILFLYWLSAGVLSCSKENLSPCADKFIGTWAVNEHFEYFENDSLVSQYDAAFDVTFQEKREGFVSHPFVESEYFDWTCDEITFTMSNTMAHFFALDDGVYTITNQTDTTITFEKHDLITGIQGTYETYRSWFLTKK